MYINYRAVRLPVSMLLFYQGDTGAMHEKGQTCWVPWQGFQGGREEDKRRESCATEASLANTILI